MTKKRIVYLDILNIIAIIAVVAMHCNGIVHGNINTRAWATSLIVDCICYFAVPLFIMISGANLMKYREKYDTKTFFKKRFMKVLIPFIFWAVFMFIWKIYILKSLELHSFKEVLNAFFANKEESTYYFVWNIIGIYLTMPLLSLLAKKENNKSLWFVVLLYFIFNAFIPNILSLVGINYNTNASVQFAGYVIFAILGYLLSNEDIKKKYKIIIIISAVLGLIYRYSTTFILSKEAGYVVKTTWGYTSWHAILLTSAVFIIVKDINFNNLSNKVKTKLAEIAGCSYAIFLIHQIVMYYEKSLLNINSASWHWRTIGVITTYLIALGITLLLKKIPVIKDIVP